MGFEWNKIFGALLACAFVVLGVNFLSDGLFHAEKPEQEGYALEGGAVAAVAGGDEPAGVESVNAMLAKMEISEGEKVAKKCVACHNFDKGGANKVGPALYGTVNRAIASVDGFGYSGALKAYADGGKTWTYDELNGFLYKPKAHVKGTSMGFAGLKKTGDRAAMIAYLRSLADTMVPLPEAEAEPAAAEGSDAKEEAPAEGEAKTEAEKAEPEATTTEETARPEAETGEEAPKTEEAPKAEDPETEEPKAEEEPKTEEGSTQSN